MNLALHGFFFQVLLSFLDLRHGSLLCSAGEPGYLDFDNLPETNFSCQGKVIGGYYADVEAGCQMFHVCTIGQKDEIMDIKFLCLNGTVFDQETRVCERVDEVDCSKSERFYNLNLELYGNNAVTLSLHEHNEGDTDQSDSSDDHQRTTSVRPVTTTTAGTTTPKPNKPSTTPSSNSFVHSTGYPQRFQPQPSFPQVHTSQSKSLYDDKNGGYHHQYIFHSGERNNNQQATSYQLFSNQGVGSTTVQPPQIHQIRFSSTPGAQIIRNEPSTVAPLFHATSSTIQTLLNSNGNSPALINPIFHSHGIASTTEQFSIHSNNPRETSEYSESEEQGIRPLEAVQSTNRGKVSKLTISPVPGQESSRSVQTRTSSHSSQQQRVSNSFLPTPAADETTVRSFYPTPRSSTKAPAQVSQSNTEQATQHIHVPPPVPVPQLKPHQITINLPPPDLQRIVQNPSSLLPSQSRVIVTAKASVSDESGRPLNTTQLVTLPLPTIPASYDDYKEGDETFDPFYRDVPKIRSNRQASAAGNARRSKRAAGQTKSSMVSFVYGGDSKRKKDVQVEGTTGKERDKVKSGSKTGPQDFRSIKESLMRFRDILFADEFTEDSIRSVFEARSPRKKASDPRAKKAKKDSMEVLETKASKNFKATEYDEDDVEDREAEQRKEDEASDEQSEVFEIPLNLDTKASDAEEYIDLADDKEYYRDEAESSEDDKRESEEEEEEEHEETVSGEKEEPVPDEREEPGPGEKGEPGPGEKEEPVPDEKEEPGPGEKEEPVAVETEEPVPVEKEEPVPVEKEEPVAVEKEEPAAVERGEPVPARESKSEPKNREAERMIDVVILNPEEYSKLKSSAQEDSPSTTEREEFSITIPFPSTTEQTTQTVIENVSKTSPQREEPKISRSRHADVEEAGQPPEPEDKQKPEKVMEEEKSKERKASPKRKSSRIRSSRRKLSAKERFVKIETEETAKVPEEKLPIENKEMETSTAVGNSEAEIIDKHIFDEPESHTSKEVDTRAVSSHNGYSKSLQTGKDQVSGKERRKGEANEYESLQKQPGTLDAEDSKASNDEELVDHEEIAPGEESKVAKLEEEKKEEKAEHEEASKRPEDSEYLEEYSEHPEEDPEHPEAVQENVSERKENGHDEESSMEHELVEDDSVAVFSNENSKEKHDGTRKSSRKEQSVKFEGFDSSRESFSHRQDKSRSFKDGEEIEERSKEIQEYSTIRNEEVNSHEVSSYEEYQDSTEAAYENTSKVPTKEHEDPEVSEDSTVSSKHASSEEMPNSKEEEEEEATLEEEHRSSSTKSSLEEDSSTKSAEEGSTEGVLKFTDELPKDKKEDKHPESKKPMGSLENAAHDYVDDNYEPDNYKERVSSDFDNLGAEKSSKEELSDSGIEDSDEESTATSQPEKSTTEVSEDDTELPETTTMTSSTSTTTTTTTRPTPPKLFKPISARKNYNYIPPTTTPNPVIIKPRLSLLNPKPAKPPKSYNDLAPKPVIRKFSTLMRKPATTVATTTTREEDSTVTEVPLAFTEISRSEENVLESKLEPANVSKKEKELAKLKEGRDQDQDQDQDRDHDQDHGQGQGQRQSQDQDQDQDQERDQDQRRSKDQEQDEERDQDFSPSEQKAPSNLRKDDDESFTPYPISRLTTLASVIEKSLKDVEWPSPEADSATTPRNFTLLDVEIVSTTAAPVPSSTEAGTPREASSTPISRSSTEEQTTLEPTTTIAFTTKDPTEIPAGLSIAEQSAATETPGREIQDAEWTTLRSSSRKITGRRRSDGFNCLEKEMYRFYGDNRDCRLFHYCSPGFTTRQVLDFRFVCEEGTTFDEESQSCRHAARGDDCVNGRQW